MGAFALHCKLVADAMRHGRVVPFLGAGVNLCDRPRGLTWQPEEKTFLPSGAELARYLAGKFFYPGRERCALAEIAELAQKGGRGETDLQAGKDVKAPPPPPPPPEEPLPSGETNLGAGNDVKAEKEGRCLRPDPDLDLLRVSQFGATMLEAGPVYEVLHALFGRDFPPTNAHRFLASLPPPKPELCRAEDRHLLVATTNYDDLMERALGEGNYDLVFYVPDDQPRARFWHRAPGKPAARIETPNEYPYVFFEQRPVVLKIHGTVDRADQEREGFVITEDQYIEYLAEEPLENLLPPGLVGKMRDQHHLLFLGYSLRDWNFRVFFRHLKRNSRRYKGWAVLLHSDEAEKQFWIKNGVDIIEQPLGDYLNALAEELKNG